MTIGEIAASEGLTRQEVHAILRRALRKLSRVAREDPQLRSAYDHWTAEKRYPTVSRLDT
jgi:DNA-directed RNA polymerase sigma subunit (sigma70/sigma32)